MSELPRNVRSGPLNLRQIEVFHAIMITGSLSAAGRLLHVTQPAISRVLASIELRLGYALFERFKGRLHPTKEARKLFQEVESIQAGVNRLNDMAAGLAGHGGGLVSVVSSPSFGEWLIPAATAKFCARNPGVRIRYRPLGMDALLPQLLLGHADIAISTFKPEHPNLITSELAQGEIVCVLRAGHRLARESVIKPAMLAGEMLVGYGRDTPLGETLHNYLGPQITPAIEVRSSQTACSFVRQGVGVALVDSYGLTDTLMHGIVVRRIEPAISLSVHVSHSRIEPPPSIAKAFLAQFSQIVKKELPAMTQAIINRA
ncbi:HTH-type transcriptional activator CmpR [Achromobacter spanius]|uniref:LysR family transcriptional regulator n=1 Tax=Achromobacter spanius TaxID=217203 RepID=UPI000C2B5DA1|nr:LysR family transcriptional regulator [Achromobacter spanius]AUA59045.1 LysR family transcriptional regulator [Achromobacter spanius]CAB3661297.1 Octopine catabolism/uptake operon regulatory protein OccR [Achromobacter spanius]SPT40462.1 HTH-type transcriptional activator CmpR [Achromobacter denitrificans]VEE58781.1 HTH-type transcriptional activator CmpR [Achromobacter spanius]